MNELSPEKRRALKRLHKYGKQVNGSNEKLLALTPIAESLAQVQ
jgi:hypothetical protein